MLALTSWHRPPAEAVADRLRSLIRGGTVYDGSGGAPYRRRRRDQGRPHRRVGRSRGQRGEHEIDAAGLAVAPGFINMLSWATESLIADGRAQSDIRQGVTLEVFGEGWSMGPLNADDEAADARAAGRHQVSSRVDHARRVPRLSRAARASPPTSPPSSARPRCASTSSARTTRPDAGAAGAHAGLVRQAMEEGALGVGSSLIYAPAFYAETPRARSRWRARPAECGGMYITHMRSEGDRLLEAVDELIDDRARGAGLPRRSTT